MVLSFSLVSHFSHISHFSSHKISWFVCVSHSQFFHSSQLLLKLFDLFISSLYNLVLTSELLSVPSIFFEVLLFSGSKLLRHLFELFPHLIALLFHHLLSVIHLLAHRLLRLKLEVSLHSLILVLSSAHKRCAKAWSVVFLLQLNRMT